MSLPFDVRVRMRKTMIPVGVRFLRPLLGGAAVLTYEHVPRTGHLRARGVTVRLPARFVLWVIKQRLWLVVR